MTTAARPRGSVYKMRDSVTRRRLPHRAGNLSTAPQTSTQPASRVTSGVSTVNRNKLPSYVTAEQARAIIDAARTTPHQLLLETLWQSGGRITEVLKLRPCDLDLEQGALRLDNLKQRQKSSKLVYVSPALVGALKRLAADTRVSPTGWLFRGQQQADAISRQYAWRLITRYARLAGVQVLDDDQLRPANARDFRHGAAVNQVRQGVPLTEVAKQLGHVRLETTAIYTELANPERRAMSDRVKW